MSPETPVRYHLSSDGGSSWTEENVFARFNSLSLHECTQLLTVAPGSAYMLRMTGQRGARIFSDTTGPFRVQDRAGPLFEWKEGQIIQYQLETTPYPRFDTLTIEFTQIRHDANRIIYSISEHSSRTGVTRSDSLIEFKDEMSRIAGWRIPLLNIYRIGDSEHDAYTVHSDQLGDYSRSATVTRGKGITELGEYRGPSGPNMELRLLE